MVSFSCCKCGDVVKKPKVISHAGQCGTTTYSCVDCMEVFDLNTINKHTSCVSEVQKYQGKWVPDFKKKIAADSDSESEETKKKAHAMQRPSRPKLSFSDSDDSDSEKPAPKKAPAPKKSPAAAPKKPVHRGSDSDSEDEKPVAKKLVAKEKKPVTLAPKRTRDSDSDSDDEDKPKKVVKPRTASPALLAKKAPSSSPAKKPSAGSSKLETLRLPSTTKASVSSDTQYFISGEPISLGSHELIGEIVDEIIAEQRALNNNANPSSSAIGQELVLRYRKRLGKAMANAIAPILEERGI